MLRLAITILLLVSAPELQAAERTFVGDSIPARFSSGSIIFTGSDSLLLNSRTLTRGTDYTVDYPGGRFDLTTIDAAATDTLFIHYEPVPAWLSQSYGRSLPEIVLTGGERAGHKRTDTEYRGPVRAAGTDIKLTGAKTFRVTSQSAGTSEFSQSLDLNISGELTPGLTIRGAVSDRGYDPAYGTVNSRLNELNKISLELQSTTFHARIGDITLADRLSSIESRSKRVEGAWLSVTEKSWYAEAAAARPKGKYQTVRFYGTDGVQGPYRIGPRSEPIVPGSEEVWLSGRLLARGANKDYTMDYPAGSITFNAANPIDSRSRIEIDFEPQATDFRGELFTTGGGVAFGDSTFMLETGWLREGDDKDEPLTGDLSPTALDILQTVGDSTTNALRSGVSPDTAGNYVLVTDSLPDSIYQYVGADTGDYAIAFSFVGDGNGSYVNFGGNRFDYVGPGNGDYLPQVTIGAPERVEQYVARMSWRTDLLGEVAGEYRRSEFDRNLLSSLDDDDNAGNLYAASLNRQWERFDQHDRIALRGRFRDATFRTRDRINNPEFNRRHHLPLEYQPRSDEQLYDGSASVTLASPVTLRSGFSVVDYDDGTGGDIIETGAELRPTQTVTLSGGWTGIRSDLVETGDTRTGDADNWLAATQWRPRNRWVVDAELEHDSRTNDFSGTQTGTRYTRGRVSAGQQTERVVIERYLEDSLLTDWTNVLERTRLELRSNRRIGNFDYTSLLAYQWLDASGSENRSFLGRSNIQYSNIKQRLTISAGYLLSEETRNSRGLTFLEVQPGEGDYVQIDGEFVPDPDGNFIRVEEILSNQAKVSRGEKSFFIRKTWEFAVIRLSTRFEEELLEDGSRNAFWLLPFYSETDEPYQYYSGRYDFDLRLIPIQGAHAVNVAASENREIRAVGGTNRERLNRKGSVTLKQVIGQTRFEQSAELFDADRDSYYTGGGVIDGYRLEALARQLIGPHELSAGGGYRNASDLQGPESRQYIAEASARLAVVSRGELRTSLELYRQELENISGFPSYTLTDNRYGERGALWAIELRYGLKKNFRLNVSLNGRHSDDRTARVTARGEMVAGF